MNNLATTHNHQRHFTRVGLAIVLCLLAMLGTIDGRSIAWAGKIGPITIQPFKNVQAMHMTLAVRMDGKTNANKPMRGTLSFDYAYSAKTDQRRFTFGGSLVANAYANDPNMKAMGLTGMSMYKLGNAYYTMFSGKTLLNGKKAMCWVAPQDPTLAFHGQFSAENVLDTLHLSSGKPVMIGTPVAEETRNGVKAVRYRLDTKATSAQLSATTGMSMALVSGSVWLAKADGHLVRIEIISQGATPLFMNNDGFIGKTTLVMDFSNINESIEIALPTACAANNLIK